MRLVLIVTFSMILGCRPQPLNGLYGENFDTAKFISVDQLLNSMEGKNMVNTTVKGTITASCQDDGCWLELSSIKGEPVHVDWDEKFHLPTDVEGKNVIVNGYAFRDSTKNGTPVVFKATGVKVSEQ